MTVHSYKSLHSEPVEEQIVKQHQPTTTHRHKGRKARTYRRRTPPGASPGTLIVDPEAPQPVIRVMAYGPQEFTEQEVVDLHGVRDFLGKWPVTWVNVEGLGSVETIRTLGAIFGLHGLALEDVINVHQRPKVEEYGQHFFIVARMPRLGERLETEQLSLFLGKNFVLTFQEGYPGDCLEPVREHIRKARSQIRVRLHQSFHWLDHRPPLTQAPS